ncbi:HNH endonuclease [Sphingomonas sp. Leaf257]|uniref:HNH endonuclease n=1 Tax=Sphingomonas sp. Leaf257 TaxID=1736309 RepID=UPI00191C2830|nr:HNH endonuclease signature motif containing protein [Sphingomonas sp. Leaf257]
MPCHPKQFGKSVRTNRRGGSTHLRDQSASYRRQRLAIFSAEPLCRYCLARGRVTPATILDHIVALALGGTNDIANLAPACRACNDAKAVIEARYAMRGHDITSISLDPQLGEWLRRARSDGNKPV